ncbi:nucleotide-binding universal stress UspA family protein [Inquilinus ginsengisoli]|uniref:Nucleotide-binding universal stress UspA family protein n=1 Tax=Inquilinus ginsengisoli TaxID=363840 RepID=A0ABU1K014_9PROT|nr:universal stress protein [Inquilinus ginsengisoli]MDR6293918.1 nucleotide-binding universal stress UspA family protein [Inquilinus ginsengisoli]
MSIQHLLVPLSGHAGDRAALDAALGLAKRFDASVEVLALRPDPQRVLAYTGAEMAVATSMLLEGAEKASNEVAARNRAVYEAAIAAAGSGPEVEFREETGSETAVVGRRGSVSDLIVTPGPSLDPTATRAVLEAALFETGRAVLIVPGPAPADFADRILVAWDGGKESARSVAAALPFLEAATAVSVYTRDEGEDRCTAADLVKYLSRHGAPSNRVTDDDPKQSVDAAIPAAAQRANAGLIVMGGYSHSRFREMILGGVTEHMLFHAPCPVLMAH